jgi:hypothetical protein
LYIYILARVPSLLALLVSSESSVLKKDVETTFFN